jgi:ADP-heptose:LPS heptosyltransferase
MLKQIELAWRRFIIRLLALSLRTRDGVRRLTRGAQPAGDGPRRQKVLFLRHDRIGDMIVSTGVLDAIAAVPGVELHVLASPSNAPVLEGQTAVRRTLVFDRKRLANWWPMRRTMQAERYDVVVDCMPTAASVTTMMLMAASGAPQRVGVAGRGIDAVLTTATPPIPFESHIVEHLRGLVSAFRTDAATANVAPRLRLTDAEVAAGEARWRAVSGTLAAPRRLLINVSAGHKSRRWPDERFAEVITTLQQRVPQLVVGLIASPGEREEAVALAARTGAHWFDTATVRDAFAMVACAHVVLTPDTSIAHAAGAFSVPVVDLLQRSKSGGWGVYHTRGANVISPDDTITGISVDMVVAALERVIAQAAERASLPPADS